MVSDKFRRFLHDYDLLDEAINRYVSSLRISFDEFMCKSIYNGIYSLDDRYTKFKDKYEDDENAALERIFEEDILFRGCAFPFRHICTHILYERNDDNQSEKFDAYNAKRQAIRIYTNTSAGFIMRGDIIELPIEYRDTKHSSTIEWCHSELFIEAQRKIRKELRGFGKFEREPASATAYCD